MWPASNYQRLPSPKGREMIALRFEETCPKCGSHLMVREGEDGDFLACPRFPACRFTKPLPDGNLKIYQKPSPYCEKCNHTGLLPFVKNGKVIPNALVDCSCKRPEPEHHESIEPEDFDFPCSYAWRSYYEETIFGRCLPTLEPELGEEMMMNMPYPKEVQSYPKRVSQEELPLSTKEAPIVNTEEPWTKRQWDTIKQLKAQVLFLSSKVNEMRANAPKKRKSKY